MVAAAEQKAAATLESDSEAADTYTGENDDYCGEAMLGSDSEAAHTGETDDYYDTT